MPSKLDEIIRSIGNFESDIKTLFRRADEDRRLQERRHDANQDAMGKLANSTQQAISELRQAIEDLTRKLEAPGSAAPLAMSRGRLVALASVGLVTLWIIGRAIEAGFSWVVAHFLNMKFGG